MLKIIKITKDTTINLPLEYKNKLNNKQIESLKAREEIFKYKKILPRVDLNGVPIFENNNFWSISHKKDIIFIGTSRFPIGIDIEVFKNRENTILNIHNIGEYSLLGDKNLLNFYKLWTIKESIIKLNLAGIDDFKYIKITSIKKKNKYISNILFDCEIKCMFENKKHICYNGTKKDLIYSVSF